MWPLMSVPASGSRAFKTRLGCLLMQAMLRIGGAGSEGIFEKGDADAFGAADFFESGGRPWPTLHHFSEQSESHRDDFVLLGQIRHRLIEECGLLLRQFVVVGRQGGKSSAECGQDFAGMAKVEEIDGGKVVALDDSQIEFGHETSRRHAEVVTHHDDALHPFAVALPQGLHQFGIFFVMLGVQPLLELVQHQQYLLPRFDESSLPERRERLDQAEVGRQIGRPVAASL